MPEPLQESVWRLVDHGAERICDPNDKGKSCDLLFFALQSEGKEYVVSVTGTGGMTVSKAVSALRAAAAQMLRAAGGDMSQLGARPADETDNLAPTGAVN